jgi:hypothetical protein
VKSIRTITYALIVLAGAYLLAMTVHVPAVTFFVAHAQWGGFLPLALATASGITRDRPVLITTVLVVLVVALPGSVEGLANALWPIGFGIALGSVIGAGIREEKEEQRGTPDSSDRRA